MSVRILSPRDLIDLVPIEDALIAIREAFRDFGNEPLLNAPRRRVHTKQGLRITVHQGIAPSSGVGGILSHAELIETDQFRQNFLHRGQPVTVVSNVSDGELIGILIGAIGFSGFPQATTGLRTASTSAIGTDLLAKPGPLKIGLFGTGKQAFFHAILLSKVRELTSLNVYSPNQEHRERFVSNIASMLSSPVRAASSPEDAIKDTDAILMCTNSSVPVVDGKYFVPGQHITSIVGSNVGLVQSGVAEHKRRELDNTTISRANIVMVASREQAIQDKQGDLYDPVLEGSTGWEDIVELGEVLIGKRKGRTASDQLTVFKNNGGQGIADLALASLALTRAKEREIGLVLET